ncbi:MAG: hypothetical protein KIT84_15120 [Labilithrix sp.]|nr:hypothetical protein [Labilithrix sp.]MCW5812355.1 hypothetical protein [Labilithrix sp.]
MRILFVLSILAMLACESSEPADTDAGTQSSASGTCDSACVYYLRCKGAESAENQASCKDACVQQGWTSAQLLEVERMDCVSGVAAIENGGSSSSGGSTCNDCNGCYWEEDTCMYTYGYVATGIKEACNRCCCP